MKLYLLEANGLYKIGITTRSMRARVKDLQTGNPHKINIVFVKSCANYLEMEKYFHKLFHSKRLIGEWFKLTKKDIDVIKNSKMYSLFKKNSYETNYRYK